MGNSDSTIGDRVNDHNSYIRNFQNQSRWMTDHMDLLSDKLLKEVRIIGTHDACSYTIVMLGDEYSVTQNVDLYHQLVGGCRFIDVRVGDWPGVSGLRTGHSIQYGDKFSDMMTHVTRFVNENPREIILINLERCGYGMEDYQKEEVKRFVESFGNRVVKSSDEWFSFNDSKMGDLWSNNKTIIFLVEDSIRDLFPEADSIGMWSTNRYYTRDTSTSFEEPLRESLDRLLMTSQNDGKTSNSIVTYSYCLTPFEGSAENPSILSDGIQKHHGFWDWANQQGDARLNIVLLDFVFGTNSHFYLPDAISYINSNFQAPKLTSATRKDHIMVLQTKGVEMKKQRRRLC
jgi:hypothetical protein